MFGSKHTFGVPMHPPNYENTRCILLWGANPLATFPTSAQRISRARARGASLIVIDPRQHRLAREAQCWLRVRPGSDGALALAMIHVLLEERLHDEEFVRKWTNGPFLVREDTGRLLMAKDLSPSEGSDGFVVWDNVRGVPVVYDPATGYDAHPIDPALEGRFACRCDGAQITCRPTFALLKELVAQYVPERSEDLTWVPADTVRHAVRMFASERPSCLFSWAGLEMHSNAMQTNRAISCFYALTGQFDAAGSNLLLTMTPNRPMAGPELLPKHKTDVRIGLTDYPLGPPANPGIVQAVGVYDAILTGRPYPVKAMVLFGNDPLLSHGDPARGAQALGALDFYVHMDLFANPSSSFADVLLPASTSWEAEALKPTFGGKGGTKEAAAWAQMRKAVDSATRRGAIGSRGYLRSRLSSRSWRTFLRR